MNEQNEIITEKELSIEQREHLEALTTYLVNIHNSLVAGFVKPLEDNEEYVIISREMLYSVLDSLAETANNFAGILGIDIQQDVPETENDTPSDSE